MRQLCKIVGAEQTSKASLLLNKEFHKTKRTRKESYCAAYCCCRTECGEMSVCVSYRESVKTVAVVWVSGLLASGKGSREEDKWQNSKEHRITRVIQS